ncbi:MAG: hypothetical protein K2X11_12385 [Acetobacteraceae bacterium]|nr:hypothetical protein [Acetobacteraceae bacterium]
MPTDTSPLLAYALRGLRRCWQPGLGRWSHKFHLDGRSEPNESVPPSDLYYSMNCLLGFARVPRRAEALPDWAGLFDRIALAMLGEQVRNRVWGMTLWAGAELDRAIPGPVWDRVRGILDAPAQIAAWTAQDAGLLLSGLSRQLSRDPGLRPAARGLRDLVLARFKGPRTLFFDAAHGPRREFASFATQVYSALALYHFGEAEHDDEALAAANDCLATLIRLQGPRGEWPWFYLARADRVIDFYEVYSVHQHGMAPAILHHAIAHGVPDARAAMQRGFDWLFGANEMGVSMLRPDLSLIYRSQARAGWRGRRAARAAMAPLAAVTGLGGGLAGGQALRLTPEMRSYEFGWVLWSWGGRPDWPGITHRPEFATERLSDAA